MRRLFDFLPALLFFAALRYLQEHKEWAAAASTSLLGLWMADSSIGMNEAPVLLAVAAAVFLTVAQAAWLMWRGRRVEITLWFALALVVLLGVATLYFQSQSFHKWKPSVLYWAMGLSFWLSQLLFGKNLPRVLLSERLQLSEKGWHRLNFAWVAFFALMGLLNLWVAHGFSTDTWIDFSLFGGIGLVLGFTLSQGLFLGRYPRDDAGSNGASADST
jgi:intracellular septation protein